MRGEDQVLKDETRDVDRLFREHDVRLKGSRSGDKRTVGKEKVISGQDAVHHKKEGKSISKLDDVLQDICQVREMIQITLEGLLKVIECMESLCGLFFDLFDKQTLGRIELLVDTGVCDREKSLEEHSDASDVIRVSSDLVHDGRNRLDQGPKVDEIFLKRNEGATGIRLFPLVDLLKQLDIVVVVMATGIAIVADDDFAVDAKAIKVVRRVDLAHDVRIDRWGCTISRANENWIVVSEGRDVVALVVLTQMKVTSGAVVVDRNSKELVVLLADPTLSV